MVDIVRRAGADPRPVTPETVLLDLGGTAAATSLSGVAHDPVTNRLWLAPDEGRSLVCLHPDGDGGWGRASAVALDPLLADLPDGDELDLEGIDLSGDELWFTGSHGLVRSQPKDLTDPVKAARRLAKVELEPARRVLGRLVIGPDGDRVPMPGAQHRALRPDATRPLVEELTDDRWIGPFTALPGKDNGLDIEGLCGIADGVLLGLRGPVLRGWAVLVTIRPGASGPGRLELDATFDQAAHRTTLVDLRGLGVRDLCRLGDDLLVLTGPTMVLDGPARVHRLAGAAASPLPPLIPADAAPVVAEIPTEGGHPEGITVLRDPTRLLVVDDGPAPGGVVRARIVPLG